MYYTIGESWRNLCHYVLFGGDKFNTWQCPEFLWDEMASAQHGLNDSNLVKIIVGQRYNESTSICSTVSANGLAPIGLKPSVGTMMVQFVSHTYRRQAQQGEAFHTTSPLWEEYTISSGFPSQRSVMKELMGSFYVYHISLIKLQGSTLSIPADCPKSHILGWYRNFLVYWYLKLDNHVVNSTCPKDKLGWIWRADDP